MEAVLNLMRNVFPELKEQEAHIRDILRRSYITDFAKFRSMVKDDQRNIISGQIDCRDWSHRKTIHLEVKMSDTNYFFLKRSYDVLGSSGILNLPLLLIQDLGDECNESYLYLERT